MAAQTGKYKKLLLNTFIFGIGQFLSKIVGFLLVIIYTHFMTEAEYSSGQLVYQTVNLLVPLVTFSMRDAVIRFGMDKAFDKRKVYTGACAALFVGMAVLALGSPLIRLNEKIGSFTVLLYIYCYFSCFRDITSTFTRSRGMVKLFMVDGVLTTITQVICNVVFIIGLKMSVRGYILSFIVSDLFSITFLYIMGNTAKYADTKYFDSKVLRQMLSFSIWLIPTYILWWVTSSSDQWFIVHMVGDTENGIYSIAYKLPTLLMFVTTMFYQAWQMSSIEEKDSRGIGKFYQTVFGSYSSLLFVAAAGLILFVKPLTFILTGDGSNGTRFYEAYAFTPILIISMLFQCFCQFLSSVYTTTKRSVNSLTTALVAALTNIVLNLFLIKAFGIWGAAIATAFSYVACFIVRLWDVRRFIYFKVNLARFGINSLAVVIMAFIAAKEPPLKYVWLTLVFVLLTSINFGNVLKTVKRLLRR
ncbi:MAG: polysaccharide biosynthesis C-terminal domain-containing protein [Oscillospiraceae bacterium]|nr:polysaccharide biosynthesis C-terminal domain-containing protein [Oscillospiraceae bacterium]